MLLLMPRLPLMWDVTAENESKSVQVIVIGDEVSALTPISGAVIETLEPINALDDWVIWSTLTAIDSADCVVGLATVPSVVELIVELALPRIPASVRLLTTPTPPD